MDVCNLQLFGVVKVLHIAHFQMIIYTLYDHMVRGRKYI